LISFLGKQPLSWWYQLFDAANDDLERRHSFALISSVSNTTGGDPYSLALVSKSPATLGDRKDCEASELTRLWKIRVEAHMTAWLGDIVMVTSCAASCEEGDRW